MWEEVMIIDRKFTIATVLATVTALTAAVSVRAGGDKIMFPAEYAKGAVYMTLERPEDKEVREYDAIQGARACATNGAPLADGDVLTVLEYPAHLAGKSKP